MSKYIRYIFETEDNKDLRIGYILRNNPVVDRWWEMTKKSFNDNMKLRSTLFNIDHSNLEVLMSRINKVLEFINKNYTTLNKEHGGKLPTFTNTDQLDTEVLNYLHEEFEVYGDRIEELKNKGRDVNGFYYFWSETLHSKFLELNEYIHMIETALHGEEKKFPNFSCLYDFLPAGLHEPVTRIDQLFLEDKFEWGGLYTGYNTLGKDYLTIAPENDIEVLERDEVRPQIRFAAETWMNFGPDMAFTTKETFYDWYKTLTPELQEKIPIDDLYKLALGRYRLGKVHLDDTFLSFEPNIREWLLPTGPSYTQYLGEDSVKLRWNKEVFSKTTKIKQILLYEGKEEVGSIWG